MLHPGFQPYINAGQAGSNHAMYKQLAVTQGAAGGARLRRGLAPGVASALACACRPSCIAACGILCSGRSLWEAAALAGPTLAAHSIA